MNKLPGSPQGFDLRSPLNVVGCCYCSDFYVDLLNFIALRLKYWVLEVCANLLINSDQIM